MVLRAPPVSEATEYSLFGGPLHQLADRLGLARGSVNDVRFGLAIGAVLWVVLAALAAAQGLGGDLLSLNVLSVHVRLLLVVPLYFAGEAAVDPRMREFSQTLVRSGVVPASAVGALRTEIARAARWRDAWLPEILCLALVVLWSMTWPLPVYGSGIVHGRSWASQWYWWVCLPLFRFLLVRWLWHIGRWTFFLWRLSRLRLHLVPTHPDGAAGIGFVEVVQAHFAPLVVAASLPLSASFAEGLVAGTMRGDDIYPAIALVLLADALLFLGPPFVFTPVLWASRVRGLAAYTEFAQRYVEAFDRKWIRDHEGATEPLLGTADVQSLADTQTAVGSVRTMRVVPFSTRLITGLAIAALAPMAPLLLIRYPVGDILKMMFAAVSGF
jgi:hypothetical protein